MNSIHTIILQKRNDLKNKRKREREINNKNVHNQAIRML
jgi:hypothetical protein